MGLKKVRLTIWPDRVVEVTDAEKLDLQRQGLILSTKKAAPTGTASTDNKKESAD